VRLNCASFATAVDSLAGLLQTTPRNLRRELRSLPLSTFDMLYSHSYILPHELLWRTLVGTITQPPIPSRVRWFHATRVKPNTDLSEGLQPLGARLPALRTHLEQLMTDFSIARAGANDDAGHFGHLYEMKTADSLHWGPYAVLVRDAIVRRDLNTHNYLRTPEIIEDLAAVLAGRNDGHLLRVFIRTTVPCIVTFESREPREDVVAIGLHYCYLATWKQAPGIEGNTCFSANGKTIPREDIVAVEYV
jgi:hypothetical protein